MHVTRSIECWWCLTQKRLPFFQALTSSCIPVLIRNNPRNTTSESGTESASSECVYVQYTSTRIVFAWWCCVCSSHYKLLFLPVTIQHSPQLVSLADSSSYVYTWYVVEKIRVLWTQKTRRHRDTRRCNAVSKQSRQRNA